MLDRQALEMQASYGDSSESNRRYLEDFEALSSEWFWELNAELKFVYVSDRFSAVTGIPTNLVLGMSNDELGMSADESDAWQEHRVLLDDHQPFRDFRYSFLHPDGRDVVVSIAGDPMFDRAGAFSGYRGTGREVSSQVCGPDNDQNTGALYKLAGRIANLGFWEWDELSDKCTFCSEELAKIHGVSVGEFLRRSTSNAADRRWMHPDDRARYEVAANLFRTEHKGFEIEYRLLRADGKVAHVREVVAPVVDRRGILIRSFGFVKDESEHKRATVEFAKVHELYRQTESLAKIGHWEWDEIKDCGAYCSEELARLCGLSVEAYLKRSKTLESDLTLVHPGDRTRYARWDAEFAKHPVRSEIEYRLPAGGDRVRDVREMIVPVFDQNNVHVRTVGLVQDITESKNIAKRLLRAHDELEQRVRNRTAALQATNDELVRSKSQLRDATRIAKLGYFKWDTTIESGIYCDDELAGILGIPVTECMTESIDDYLARVHPDDVAKVSASYEDSRAHGVPVDMEYRVIRASGEIRHVHELSTPKTDKGGCVVQTFGTLQDITDRKTIGEELAMVKERLHELGANAREVLYVLSADWREVIYVSEAFKDIWGHSCQSVLDNPRLWIDSLHPDDQEMIRIEIENKMSGNDPTPEFSDARIIGPDGDVHWLSTRVYPIRDNNDVIVRLAGVAEDITERKTATDALHQAQKMDAVGQLTGGVAHDFNNLLAVILGNSRLLQGRLLEEDEPLLQDIVAAGNRGAELTRRLLAFSRLQPLQPVMTDIVNLVANMGELLARTLGATISVEFESSCGDVRALVDPCLLENAILNLSLNARDAMPDGGRLKIRVADAIPDEPDSSSEITITVEDNGVGMDADILPRALEPFFTTKNPGNGGGLGLPMVYGFVKQSNGDLTIDSTLGVGTIVTIRLPCGPRKATYK